MLVESAMCYSFMAAMICLPVASVFYLYLMNVHSVLFCSPNIDIDLVYRFDALLNPPYRYAETRLFLQHKICSACPHWDNELRTCISNFPSTCTILLRTGM